MVGHFADRLMEATRAVGTPLCCGIDPHPDLIPGLFGKKNSVIAVRDFYFALLLRLKGKVGIIKPQAAFFERLGADGIRLLEDICTAARDAGLLVIMDAKRGDIGTTASAYAEAYLGTSAAFKCDALTVNPFLGMETIRPFLDAATKNGKGIFVLLRTSNPGAADMQLLELTDGKPLYENIAESLAPLMEENTGASGYSNIGVVVGATTPDEAKRIREILPKALFLIPGYGAQGGSAKDALAGLVKTNSGFEGGVINSSRGLIFPKGAEDAPDMETWEKIIDQAIDHAINDFREPAFI